MGIRHLPGRPTWPLFVLLAALVAGYVLVRSDLNGIATTDGGSSIAGAPSPDAQTTEPGGSPSASEERQLPERPSRGSAPSESELATPERATAPGNPFAADGSRMTKQEKRDALTSAYEMWQRSKDLPAGRGADSDLALASRCVISILRAEGRADYGTPDEIARRGGFSLRPTEPGEHVIAGDYARFAFMEGEFPAYDLAQARMALTGTPGELQSPARESDQHLEALYLDALEALDAVE